MRLLVATNNLGKQKEIAEILTTANLQICFPTDIPALTNITVTESGITFAENAKIKARLFANKSGLLTVADDSGLQIEALSGWPGVVSNRWFKGTDAQRNSALLKKLTGQKNRRAKFVTVAYIYDPKTQHGQKFVGEMVGTIAKDCSGNDGFAYDQIFVPTGKKHTLAKLGMKVKNKISHRSKAFYKVKSYLNNQL